MKRFMMKYFMINCRESTLLMAKKEEGRLSFMEKFNLALHISMCNFCRKFEKQMAKIKKESINISADDNLSQPSRENIIESLKKYNS